MKIMHVVQYFNPAWAYGGTPRAVFEIAKRQVKLGHEVTVLSTNAYDKSQILPAGQVTIDGIKVIRLRNLSNYLVWNYRLGIPVEINFTKINLDGFDIIHFHETRTLLNILVLNQIKKQKVIYSPWGTLPFNNQQPIIKKLFDAFFLLKFKKRIDLSIAQNLHERNVLNEFGFNKKIELIPLGIEINFFKNLPDRAGARRKLGLIKGDKVFLFLGRFTKAKGLNLLIESFKKVSEKSINLKLLLIGRDDGFLKEINSERNENIIVSGPLYGDDRLLAYSAADYFIFTPTVYEETATVCLEALACNLPVIVTRQAQIPYLNFEDGVFEVDANVDKVSEAIETILSKASKVNRKKIVDNFDWDKIVARITSSYLENIR